MAKETKDPRWILSEDWAVDVDHFNWRLYQRIHNKDGEPAGWKILGYYGKLETLLKHLHEYMLRHSKEPEENLMSHITRIREEWLTILEQNNVLIELEPKFTRNEQGQLVMS